MKKPAVFIASSVEGLAVADAINVNLDHDVHCTLWRNGTFKLGSDALVNLIAKSSAVDFAVFVFTPDDITSMRGTQLAVARDNVVFELGLFIGSLGKDRCYVVKPRGAEMHLPSDVAGVVTADYVADRPDGDTASALNAACTGIKDRIKELGMLPRSQLTQVRTPGQHVPNPPNYTLQSVDLKFLAQCVQSHVAFPTGLSFSSIQARLKGEPDYRISLSAVKLMRLGYTEKSVETDNSNGEQYFAYRATEDGLDIFLKHEAGYEAIQVASAAKASSNGGGYGRSAPPRTASKSASGFDDMDDNIPY